MKLKTNTKECTAKLVGLIDNTKKKDWFNENKEEGLNKDLNHRTIWMINDNKELVTDKEVIKQIFKI